MQICIWWNCEACGGTSLALSLSQVPQWVWAVCRRNWAEFVTDSVDEAVKPPHTLQEQLVSHQWKLLFSHGCFTSSVSSNAWLQIREMQSQYVHLRLWLSRTNEALWWQERHFTSFSTASFSSTQIWVHNNTANHWNGDRIIPWSGVSFNLTTRTGTDMIQKQICVFLQFALY